MSVRLTVKEILQRTVEHFTKYGIPNPRLDAEVLLADLLGIERIQLYVRFDQPLNKNEIDQYRQRVVWRSKRVPVQYILDRQEFMSLEFQVNKHVLIPRPETELLVETVIDFVQESNLESPVIADIGTGSGVIAVSLAHYLPQARVIATDISGEALELAKENAKQHEVSHQIKFLKGSFLTPLTEIKQKVDVLVANPPYIDQQGLEELPPEVKYEPQLALDGGSDGLAAYRQIIGNNLSHGLNALLKTSGLLAVEVGANQGEQVASLMAKDFRQIMIIPDLAGFGRVVLGRKK